jgi:hypothetical protein
MKSLAGCWLEHYRTDRTYQLDYDGTGGKHHAEMIVRTEYQAPGRKYFTVLSESGSKVLCKEGLQQGGLSWKGLGEHG